MENLMPSIFQNTNTPVLVVNLLVDTQKIYFEETGFLTFPKQSKWQYLLLYYISRYRYWNFKGS